jgi:hypothetical protein
MRCGWLSGALTGLAALSFLTAAVAEPLRLDVREASVGSDEGTAAPILTIKLADGMREAALHDGEPRAPDRAAHRR